MLDITVSQNCSTKQLKILLEKIATKSKGFSFRNYLCFSSQAIYFEISLASVCISNSASLEDSQSIRPQSFCSVEYSDMTLK